jgi:hypothetical protein
MTDKEIVLRALKAEWECSDYPTRTQIDNIIKNKT